MLNRSGHCKNVKPSYKTERPITSLPETAVTLNSLKVLECELQRREFLRTTGCFPLWFHAETERNIFLWRRGCSLIQLDEFDFWVDIPKLIEKRFEHLARPQGDSPLSNPYWGISSASNAGAEVEKRYLEDLIASLRSIQSHAHALSVVAGEVCRELGIENLEREVVILPTARLNKMS